MISSSASPSSENLRVSSEAYQKKWQAARDDDLERDRELFSDRHVKFGGNACWAWISATLKAGYGITWAPDHQQHMLAHRLSWILHHGPIPEGLLVCHRCDNPNCVNPDHLFLGTPQDNARDLYAKGRRSDLKLTDDDVAEIRKLAGKVSQARLARRFSVSGACISKIVNGKARTFAHQTPARGKDRNAA